jgi:hypothetical protein
MSFELRINNEVKPIHRETSFRLSWRLGGRGTLSFSTFSLDGSYEPALGAGVDLRMDGAVIWSGNLARVKTTAMYGSTEPGTPSMSACEAITLESRLDKRIVPLAVYVNKTCKEIITDCLWVKLASGSPAVTELVGDLDQVLDGATIDRYVIDHARFSDVLDDLAARSGYCWFVEPVTQDLYFIPRTSSPVLIPAPFSISDADPNCREVSVERMLDGYRNWQYIRISYAAFTAPTQDIPGDGVTQQWTLQAGSPLSDSLVNYLESVTVLEGSPAGAETAKTFGVHGIDTDRDFYYSPGESTIWQDAAGAPLDASQTLRVTWRALGADVMDVYDSTAQAYRVIAENGGTGIYDHLIDDSGAADATSELAKAQAILDAKSIIPVEISGVTDEPGLRPGQVMTVALGVPNAAAAVLIDTVDATPLGGALRYTFHASTTAYDDWVAVWNQALGGGGGGGISASGVTGAAASDITGYVPPAAPSAPTSPTITVNDQASNFSLTTAWTAPSPIGSTVGYDREVRYSSDNAGASPVSDWIPLGAVGLVVTADSGPWPRPITVQYIQFRVRGINSADEKSAWIDSAAPLPTVAVAPRDEGIPGGLSLVLNPGAEDGLNHWANLGDCAVLTADSSQRVSGSYCFCLTNNVSGAGYGVAYSDAIVATEGETYRFTYSRRASSVTAGTICFALVGGYGPADPLVLGEVDTKPPTANQWQEIVQDVTVPVGSGVTTLRVIIYSSKPAYRNDTLLAYFDELHLAVYTPAPTAPSAVTIDVDEGTVDFSLTVGWTPASPIGGTVAWDREVQYYTDSGCTTPDSAWIPLGQIPYEAGVVSSDTDRWPRVAYDTWIKARVRGVGADNRVSAWTTSAAHKRNAYSGAVPAGEAPNQTPVTAGGTACRVAYSARGVQTVWQFAGAVTFATSAATYADLATVEIAAILTSGDAAERILGYLTPPAAGGGNLDVTWFTDLWPLPVGADDTWKLAFRSLNADGVATAAAPEVTGLIVRHDTTATTLTIPPVTSLDVTNWGIDPVQKTQGFRVAWTNPSDMSNVFGFQIRIATPGIPGGQPVTGILPYPAFAAGLAVAHIVTINSSDIPFIAENWTFSVVTINAAQDGNNLSAPAPTDIIAVSAAGVVPDLIAPLLPATVAGADTVSRMLLGNAEPYTLIRATVTLPANHRAEWLMLWVSEDNGTNWTLVTPNWAVAAGLTFDFPMRVPATDQTDWKVKVTTGSVQASNLESTAVVSAAFSVGKVAAPASNTVSDFAVGTLTYSAPDQDGNKTWGLTYVRWTMPTMAADPNLLRILYRVQVVDGSGNASPYWDGANREVDGSSSFGAVFTSTGVKGWQVKAASDIYHHHRLKLYGINRAGVETQILGAAAGADYIDVVPTEQAGTLQVQRADPLVLGPNFSVGLEKAGGTSLLRLANTVPTNLASNSDFQLASPTTASWPDKWTKTGTVTRETSAESGDYMLKFANGGSITGEKIRVAPGEQYNITLRTKGESGANGYIFLTINVYRADGTFIESYYPGFRPDTAWETQGYTYKIKTAAEYGYVPYYIAACLFVSGETGGKFYWADRVQVSPITVQQDVYGAGVTTVVTLGQHLNPVSQFVGVGVKRSTGWSTEQRDDYFEVKCPSGRTVAILGGTDSTPDLGYLFLASDDASNYPRLVTNLALSSFYLFFDATHYIGLYADGSGGRLDINGNIVVNSRGAHIANPSGGATVDSQARTAINSILAALETHGLLATS